MNRITSLLSVILIAFIGCESGLVAPGTQSTLPADQIADVVRDSEFDYSVLAPVRLSITVNSFDGATGGSRALAGEAVPIIVSVDDVHGPLFIAAVSDGETIHGEIFVPVSTDSVTLTIDSLTHVAREVVIDDPAQYAEINRTMAVAVDPDGPLLSDRDGDGIADVYDAFPDDPELAFSRSIPASDTLKIAFEDNFPELGDGDYNDFVAEFSIVEYRSAKNSLVRLEGFARAVARGAGYDHEFGIVVDFIGHEGTATVRSFDGNGEAIATTVEDVSESVRIVLFESTKGAFTRESSRVTMDNIDPDDPLSLGHTTTFTIEYTTGKQDKSKSVWDAYNPYLLIDNPNLSYRPDVHLIGKSPLPDSENPPGFEDFRDPDGYPRALLVPTDWRTPRERTHIEVAYPDFALWRESLGATNSDWYLYPDPEHVVTFE